MNIIFKAILWSAVLDRKLGSLFVLQRSGRSITRDLVALSQGHSRGDDRLFVVFWVITEVVPVNTEEIKHGCSSTMSHWGPSGLFLLQTLTAFIASAHKVKLWNTDTRLSFLSIISWRLLISCCLALALHVKGSGTSRCGGRGIKHCVASVLGSVETSSCSKYIEIHPQILHVQLEIW